MPSPNEMLERLQKEIDDSQPFDTERLPDHVQLLYKLYEEYTSGDESELKPGTLAIWKEGLKNKRKPKYGEPAIVVEISADEASRLLNQGDDSGSPYFNEPLDLKLAVLDSDGELLMYFYDRKRFKLFNPNH
ncbi:MAG: hypothetical protein NXI21_00210 [Alphaproteobacteria bacterium]|nr:hypothetical protein [Alphaproteobacteria bacterium]